MAIQRIGKDFVIPTQEGRFNLEDLNPGWVADAAYQSAQATLVRACHDVYIDTEFEGKRGLLLVIRDNEPGKGWLWPIGGGMRRGMTTEESLRRLALKECELELSDITDLGGDRVFSSMNPYSTSLGTDDWGQNFYARGHGVVNLDKLHKEPRVVTATEYFQQLKGNVYPYVEKFIERAFEAMHKIR